MCCCVCVCAHGYVLGHDWIFVTPWTVALQAPLSMGFPGREYCSRLLFLTPGDLPDPQFRPTSLESPALTGGFFTTVPPRKLMYVQFSSDHSLSRVRLFATPWIAARKASLSITNSRSSLRLMSIELVMPSGHLILCRPLLLLPPIPPSIRVFSNNSTLHMRWPKYWTFSFSIIPSKEIPALISFRMDWLDHLAVQGTLRIFSNTTVQKHQFLGTQPSSQSNSHIHTWPLEKP